MMTSPAVKIVYGNYPRKSQRNVDESPRSTEFVVNNRVEFKETLA